MTRVRRPAWFMFFPFQVVILATALSSSGWKSMHHNLPMVRGRPKYLVGNLVRLAGRGCRISSRSMGLSRDACHPPKYLSALAINGENTERHSFSLDSGRPRYIWGNSPNWQPRMPFRALTIAGGVCIGTMVLLLKLIQRQVAAKKRSKTSFSICKLRQFAARRIKVSSAYCSTGNGRSGAARC